MKYIHDDTVVLWYCSLGPTVCRVQHTARSWSEGIQTCVQASHYPTGTNLEDEDVVAKNVLDVDGRTYYQYESYAPYGTNGSHQVTRATTKVRYCLLTCSYLCKLPSSCVMSVSCHSINQPCDNICIDFDLSLELHHLICMVLAQGKCAYLFISSASDKQWPKGEKHLRQAMESFRV